MRSVTPEPLRLHLADLPAKVRALLPAEPAFEAARHGRCSTVAFVGEPGRGLVLKRADAAPYGEWLGVEVEILGALATTGLPVPRVVAFEHADDGSAWLVTTRLPGVPLTDHLDAAPREQWPRWFQALGQLLGRVHTTVVPDALLERSSTPWFRRPRPDLPGTSGEAVLSATHLDERPEPPEVFVHGDFTLDNVLADRDGLSGIVDWGGAGRGDPRYDVALALLSASEQQAGLPEPGCVQAFHAGYLDAVRGHPELFAFFSSGR